MKSLTEAQLKALLAEAWENGYESADCFYGCEKEKPEFMEREREIKLKELVNKA